jgi:FAD/FMN-containing dehydrogenase
MAAAVLRNFRDVMSGAPDEVGAGVALLTAPDEPFIPESLRGRPAAGVMLCYAGPVEEGAEPLRGLRDVGPPALDLVQPMPYVALQALLDAGYPVGLRNHWTGDFLGGLPDEAIDTLCEWHLSRPSPLTQILTLPGGGAPARVPADATPLGERDAPFNVHITTMWRDAAADAENVAWTRALGAALKPFATGRVYVNFIGDEGEERVIASFGRERYARLQALKDRFDPENRFRTSQNIRPSTSPRSPARTSRRSGGA